MSRRYQPKKHKTILQCGYIFNKVQMILLNWNLTSEKIMFY